MSEYKLNPILEYQNEKLKEVLNMRLDKMNIEERLRATSMSPMFSFWREVQDCLINAADEIARLKAKVKELESSN